MDEDPTPEAARHSGHLAVVPARAYDDVSLTPVDVTVLGCLATYANKLGVCVVRQATLAARLRLSRPHVCTTLGKLEQRGYIISARRFWRESGGEVAKVYRVVYDGLDPRYLTVTGGVSPDEQGVLAPANTGCSPGRTPIERPISERYGMNEREGQPTGDDGPAEPDPRLLAYESSRDPDTGEVTHWHPRGAPEVGTWAHGAAWARSREGVAYRERFYGAHTARTRPWKYTEAYLAWCADKGLPRP